MGCASDPLINGTQQRLAGSRRDLGGIAVPTRAYHLLMAALLLATCGAAAQPLVVGGDPRVDPADFEITLFASGLDFPLSMQELADGALLVGVGPSDGTPGGNFRDANGELLRLEDADGDGVADGPGTALYSGLPGAVTSLRLIADLCFVASVNVAGAPRITILRQGPTPSDPFSLIGSVDFGYPLPWSHFTFSFAAREAPALGHYELFFQVGSRENDIATIDTVSYSGLVSGTASADAIHRLEIDDTGPALVVAGLSQIATGVRNGWGLAFQPSTGDLYFEDNGFADPNGIVRMTDELNRLSAADLGGAIEDFGFPDNYIHYRTGAEVGSGGVDPVVAFQPVPPPNGAESKGPAAISFAPPHFPPGLDSGVFVGFHGGFVSAGASNTTNPVVYVDLDTLEHFHFVSNDQPGIGHPDGLLATRDSLFVADFTNASGLATFGSGAIYQIRSRAPQVPAASAGALAFVAAALGALGAWALLAPKTGETGSRHRGHA